MVEIRRARADELEAVGRATVAAYAAYLLGLASAVPAGKADWPEPQRMVVRRPYPPVAPPTALHDRPELYVVRSFDESIDLLARQVRLGQPIEVDMWDAEPEVRSAVRLFVGPAS